MSQDKIIYRNSYDISGTQLRSFDVFGYRISEEISIEKKDEYTMVLHNYKEKAQLIVHLKNLIDNVTVDQFTEEFIRMCNLPNEGKKLK